MIFPNYLVASLPPQEYTGFLQELWNSSARPVSAELAIIHRGKMGRAQSSERESAGHEQKVSPGCQRHFVGVQHARTASIWRGEG